MPDLGLAPWLVERYRKLSDRFYEENKHLTIRKSIIATGFSVVGLIGYYGAYVVILLRAVSGAITLGSLTFFSRCCFHAKP